METGYGAGREIATPLFRAARWTERGGEPAEAGVASSGNITFAPDGKRSARLQNFAQLIADRQLADANPRRGVDRVGQRG